MSANPQPAYEGREPYVFVSYSHEDREDVYAEIAGLQDQGVNIWYDASGLSAGSEWSNALAAAIRVPVTSSTSSRRIRLHPNTVGGS